MAPRRVILQHGSTNPCDLVVYAHIDPRAIQKQVSETTRAAAVVEFWGEGTAAYRPVLGEHGGWGGYLRALSAKMGHEFRRTCLTTWSAGSQVAKDAASSAVTPDAMVLLDGLYAAKPAGAKPGDGKVVWDPGLTALAAYAVQAARGQKTMVILHSRIATPYGSSKECAEAIQGVVERELRSSMESAAVTTLGRTPVEVLRAGSLHILEFAGRDAAEHIAQAHLYDEAWREWVSWLVEPNPPPPAAPTWAEETVGTLALRVALEELAAGVREDPPGSNKVKPAYWAGCSRADAKTGRETLLKLTVGPWCAASFQWCAYEAARRAGIFAPGDFLAGPIPHGRRVSVIELQHDFRRAGMFHDAEEARGGAYEPAPGDAVFLSRANSGSDSGEQDWVGHVTRYIRRVDGEQYEAVGGNEADGWRRTVRKFRAPGLRGFGSYPRLNAAPRPASNTLPAAIDGTIAAAIDRQYREWVAGARGVDV
jgi:hypothetical protein